MLKRSVTLLPFQLEGRAISVRTRIPIGLLAAFTIGLLAAAPASAAPTPAPAATGSVGIRLLDAPVSASNDPRARVYIVDRLAPGTTIHRRIEANNTGGAAARVVFYSGAASIKAGSFLGANGKTANEISGWTSINPASADIPAGGKAVATVTIAIPKDASPGEKYGVVWGQTEAAPAKGSTVSQVSRVGIRLYVSVGPGGAPASNFKIDSLTAKRTADGKAVVVATVHNTGGRALDMNGTMTLKDGPGGLSAGPFPASLGVSLAIGDTEPVTITLDKRLPAGPWKAQITLKSGLLTRTGEATLTFPAAGSAAAVLAKKDSSSSWLLPAIAGVAVIVLAGAGTGVFKVRKRRRAGNDTA
jgi:hypothetical protein